MGVIVTKGAQSQGSAQTGRDPVLARCSPQDLLNVVGDPSTCCPSDLRFSLKFAGSLRPHPADTDITLVCYSNIRPWEAKGPAQNHVIKRYAQTQP